MDKETDEIMCNVCGKERAWIEMSLSGCRGCVLKCFTPTKSLSKIWRELENENTVPPK